MRYAIRRHPIAFGLFILFFSPYIAAIALLIAVAYVLAVLFDALLTPGR